MHVFVFSRGDCTQFNTFSMPNFPYVMPGFPYVMPGFPYVMPGFPYVMPGSIRHPIL